MRHFTAESIAGLDERFRRNLINSLHGVRPALLVGTTSATGTDNLAVFSQVLHIGANPPLTGILFRPDSVERHTLTNIRNNGAFTLNTATTAMMLPIVDAVAEAINTKVDEVRGLVGFNDKSVNTLRPKI